MVEYNVEPDPSAARVGGQLWGSAQIIPFRNHFLCTHDRAHGSTCHQVFSQIEKAFFPQNLWSIRMKAAL